MPITFLVRCVSQREMLKNEQRVALPTASILARERSKHARVNDDESTRIINARVNSEKKEERTETHPSVVLPTAKKEFLIID